MLHVPAEYDGESPLPLVVLLHGGGGDADEVARDTNFSDLADEGIFFVVYPNAVDGIWADGRGTSRNEIRGVDDVGFINTLVDCLSGKLPVDQKRIYLAGVSNGSILSHRIACQQGERFAAFAGVAGTFPERILGTCNISEPMPAVFFHGTLDNLSPFDGGEVGSIRGGAVLSVSSTMETWAALNQCSSLVLVSDEPNVDPTDGTSVRRETQDGCSGGASIVTYVIENGGHTWPDGPGGGGELFGNITRDINATRTIWNFFRQYSKP